MSKKQLRSRLDHLFSDLAGDENQPVEQEQPTGQDPTPKRESAASERDTHPLSFEKPAYLTGWTWEIDAAKNYISCGLEVSDALRMNPHSFLGKSILNFGLHSSSKASLESALLQSNFPTERNVLYEPRPNDFVAVRIHILARLENNGVITGWRGFAQRIPEEITLPGSDSGQSTVPNRNGYEPGASNASAGRLDSSDTQPSEPRPAHSNGTVSIETSPSIPLVPIATEPRNTKPLSVESVTPVSPPQVIPQTPKHGYAVERGQLQPATTIWTEPGKHSLAKNEMTLTNSSESRPASIAVPLSMQGVGDLLLEIVDDSQDRDWSEDDRFLVMEIAAQLALALDNAQLYISVQQELAERIRAEHATLRRNKDLATLNQLGQQLSRLATRAEIFDLLATVIGEVLDNSNLYICAHAPARGLLTFPVYMQDGKAISMPDQPFGNGIPEFVIRSRSPLLIDHQVAEEIKKHDLESPARLPLSLLAIPMIAGDRAVGAIIVQDFEHEEAFDPIHLELLSTAASQATTALENADLFRQMQSALEAIENRERYQANVARAAAILTELGTKSMPEVLKTLGLAARCSRVYFAHVHEDDRGIAWGASAEWIDPSVAYLFDKTRILHIPVNYYQNWSHTLREKGWVVTHSTEENSSEAEFLNQQHVRTTLLLAVPGASSTPNFLAFDQLSDQRTWLNEEINALRVAADAISNTFVREGLLDQLQITLDETEGLYKASNRLASANDMQEMVAAILSGVRTPEVNRSILLLFEYDNYLKISQITVGANWYSGRGTPPPPVGTEYLRTKYERFFQTSTPIFFDDIIEAQIDKELQDTLLHQNIRALAILPLWSGKRQIGVLLLQSETKHHFTGRETRTYPPLVDQMAISVENQRLFDQTQRALSETELLYNVSNRIAQAAGTRDMLALVVETVLPTGADRATLIMIESDSTGDLVDLEIVGNYDSRGEYQSLGQHYPISALPLIKSLTEEPLIVTDVNQYPLDPASRKTLDQMQIAASCMVPLRTSGRLMGVLAASARRATEFSQEDTRLLRIVGSGIAVALEKQRLLRQAQRRALELQTASEIARDTASTLSLDLLLNRIVNMLSERFGFYHASIFLLDDTGTYATIRESTGDAGHEMKQRGHRLAVGSRSVVGTVTATGEPFILNDVSNSQMFLSNPMLTDTRSEMGVPLKMGSTVIGALDLQSKDINAFNQDDVTVLQILADQIAIAIENARAYELSQKAIADMKEIDRVKSQFLANMSHELRTPLNSIIGFSRVILKGIDGAINDTQKQDLTAIYNSGQHLLNLINDILDLSKIEAGKMELSFSEFNLNDMINSAMSTAIGLVKDKPIRLQTQIPENLPRVHADNTRVRQVLINFLSNAAKFTDEGNITVEAMLVNGPKGDPEVMVTVTDSGPGIAAEDQAKLFLPFSQVDDSPTRKTGGTGLGLSICRSLIEMHGGRIGLLRSEVDKGSTFFFTLQVSEPDQVKIQPELVENLSNTILAIDDDARVISLYERYLKPHGYQVLALTDPKQAVERIKQVKPFAITLDIMMPDKDGWTVLRDLKNDPETREIPIVICSILENQEKGFSMGAADYLVKPFLQEDLLNSISRLNRDGQIHEVLLVDDDPEDLRLLQKMLEANKHLHISVAKSGKDGWECIQANRPDVVILDLFMPDMDGFNILQNLRSSPTLRHTPVIVLTGVDLSAEQLQQLTDFGQRVLSKGFLREKELLVLLEEALRKFSPVKRDE